MKLIFKHYTQNELSQWREEKRKLETGQFNSSRIGRSLIGSALAMDPRASQTAISEITTMLIGGVLHSAVSPIDKKGNKWLPI